MAAAREPALSVDRVEILAELLGGGVNPVQKNVIDSQGFLFVDVGIEVLFGFK